MVAFLKLVRYKNLLMVLLTLVLTKYAITNTFTTLFDTQFILLIISILSITASGYVINDIVDVKADVINKPTKVYIDVSISKQKAYTFYYVLSAIGLITGFVVANLNGNSSYALFFIGTILLLFWYSKSLKRVAFIGNIVVAFLTAFTLFIVVVFEKNDASSPTNIVNALASFFTSLSVNIAVFIYIIFAFSISLIREIIKDIEDVKGDYALKMKTLPIVIGINRTKNIALVISSIVLVFLLLVLKEELIHIQLLFWYAILFIIVPFTWFIFKLFSAKSNTNYSKLSTLLKLIMCFGILSMLFIQL